MRGTTLLLATGSYPYDAAAESTFVRPELEPLRAAFDRVVLVPALVGGARDALPAGVEVDESYAAARARVSPPAAAARALRAPGLLLADLAARRGAAAAPDSAKRLLVYAGHARAARDWFRGWLGRSGADPARTVVYTYWLSEVTLGAGMTRRGGGPRVVSRTHGIDVYEERSGRGYLPLRRATYGAVDRLFPISAHGLAYVRARYGAFAPPAEVSRLGVPDPGFQAPASDDGVLRVVSCSYVVPVKRLDLLARAVEHLARARPDGRVEWTHVGGGAGREALAALAERILPANAAARFTGDLPNAEVLALYRRAPVDVFVNVSASEGIPVSIMEACSCGIPVVATAVGGTPEAVGAENGILLSADPDAAEVAAALGRLAEEPGLRRRLGAGSRAAWSARFDAGRNAAAFAGRLAALAEGTAPARRPALEATA